MNQNIPDYEKISLINEYQESIERLEAQITEAEKALKAKKKRIKERLSQDRSRLAAQVKKEKDSIVTKQELDKFREQEASEYAQTLKSYNHEVEKFLDSQEYYNFVRDFYRQHESQITTVVAPKELAKQLDLSKAQADGDRLVFQTADVDYDFTPRHLRAEIVKKLLVQ